MLNRVLFLFVAAATVVLGSSQAIAATATGTLDSEPFASLSLPQSASPAVDAARKSVAAGNLDDAIAELSAYVSAHPHDLEAAKYLGGLYYRKPDFKNAEIAYQHVLDESPTDAEAHNRLGGIYSAEDRVSDAIDQFTQSVSVTWNAYGRLVDLYRRRGDLDKAIASAKRRADRLPQDYIAQYNLGRLYAAEHDYSDAADYLERATALSKGDCAPMSALGSVLYDLGEHLHAFQTWNRCLSRSPDDYGALVNRGNAYIQLSQFKLARADFEHANRVRPDGPESLVDLGYLEDTAGQWHAAITYYLGAIAVDPLTSEAYTNMGYDYVEHKLYALAEAAYVKGLSMSPSDGRLHYLLAVAYAEQKKRDLAIKEYQRAAASDDDDVVSAAQHDLAQLEGRSQ